MKVAFVGNLTKDVELNHTQDGKAYAKFTVAENVGYGDKKSTNYIDCTVWNGTAENCAKFLSKGKKVYCVGEFNQDNYNTSDGQKRTVWKCRPLEVQFLSDPAKTTELDGATPCDDDDMPF